MANHKKVLSRFSKTAKGKPDTWIRRRALDDENTHINTAKGLISGIIIGIIIWVFVLVGVSLTTCAHADNSMTQMNIVEKDCFILDPGTLKGWTILDSTDRLRVSELAGKHKVKLRHEPIFLCKSTQSDKVSDDEVRYVWLWRMK